MAGAVIPPTSSRKPLPTKVKLGTSVRASSPFDVAEERMRQERKWAKLRRMGKTNFIAGTKAPQPHYTRGINEGCEYIEPQTLRLSTKEILAKQKDKYVSKKPFLMAVETGRLFDED